MKLLNFIFQDVPHFAGCVLILWLLIEGATGLAKVFMRYEDKASTAFWESTRKGKDE